MQMLQHETVTLLQALPVEVQRLHVHPPHSARNMQNLSMADIVMQKSTTHTGTNNYQTLIETVNELTQLNMQKQSGLLKSFRFIASCVKKKPGVILLDVDRLTVVGARSAVQFPHPRVDDDRCAGCGGCDTG